jgi:hypothetical protein
VDDRQIDLDTDELAAGPSSDLGMADELATVDDAVRREAGQEGVGVVRGGGVDHGADRAGSAIVMDGSW